MQILNQFFRKKIYYIVVISVPSFHQAARSSSFFLAFSLQFYGTTFYGWPYIDARFFFFWKIWISDGHANDVVSKSQKETQMTMRAENRRSSLMLPVRAVKTARKPTRFCGPALYAGLLRRKRMGKRHKNPPLPRSWLQAAGKGHWCCRKRALMLPEKALDAAGVGGKDCRKRLLNSVERTIHVADKDFCHCEKNSNSG